MASGNADTLFAQQKKAVDILRTSGTEKYGLFLKKSDIIDFLNEDEKQYIADLRLEEIIYSEVDDEEEEQMSLRFEGVTTNSTDPEVYSSLEVDTPAAAVIAKRDPETKMVFSPGILKTIVKIIAKCTSSINIAMFMFTDPAILQKICEIKELRSEIRVRILVDETQFDEFLAMAKKVIKKKFDNRQIGIKVKRISRKGKASPKSRSGVAHEKFLIVDASTAVTGSYNFTWAAEMLNHEHVIISRDKEAIVTPLLNHYKKLSRNGKFEIL